LVNNYCAFAFLARDKPRAEKDSKLTELPTGKAALDAELERLRAEIAAIKKQNEATPDEHIAL
jgi:type I restriction enzyme R subunit